MSMAATPLIGLGPAQPNGKVIQHLHNVSSQVQDAWMAIGLTDSEGVRRMTEIREGAGGPIWLASFLCVSGTELRY